MRRSILLGAVLALVLGSLVYVEAQRGRGRGGGGGGAQFALERDWALICFELYVTGDQLERARTAFIKAYGERKKAMEGMGSEEGGAEPVQAAVTRIQQELEGKYASLFSKRQLEHLNRVKASSGGGGGRGR